MHRRAVAAIAVLFALVGGLLPHASAAQPPNSDEKRQSKSDIERTAERAEAIAEQVSQAEDALTAAQLELAAAYDKVTAAQRKASASKAAAESARVTADETHKKAAAAASRLREARNEVDKLAAASFQLGNLDSARALLGADDIQDLLARASLLDAISAAQRDALDDLRRASSAKADEEAAAKTALRKAVDKRAAAQRAVKSAKQAYQKARSGEQAAQQRAEDLVEKQQALRSRLDQARQKLAVLRQKQGHEQGQSRSPHSAPSPAETPVLANAAQGVTAAVVAPTTGTITSSYGPRGGTIHYGLDIANGIGTPVVSAMDGTVISSGPSSGFGLWVRVRHGNGIVTVYGHIHESLVSVGQRVSAGQQIATIGNRGQSTGPHMHFGVSRSGSKINPLTWLRAHGVSL